MRRLFVQSSGSQPSNLMAWDIRQGLPELYVGGYEGVFRGSYEFAGNSAIPMPDGAIYLAGYGTNNFNRVDNIEVGGAMSRPTPSFSGAVRCQAVSDRYWAIGGDSPFLYVFDRLSFAFSTVPTTGLSTVVSLAFSPDGSRLAVGTYLPAKTRLYNTADWTYVDSPAYYYHARSIVEFTPDGTRLVVIGCHPSSDGYVSTLNPETLEVISGPSATVTYNGFTGSWSWAGGGVYALKRGRGGKEMFASVTTRYYQPIRFNGETLVIEGQGGLAENGLLSLDHHGGRLLTNNYYDNQLVGQITGLDSKTMSLTWLPEVNKLRVPINGYPCGAYPFVYTSNPHQITGTVRDITNSPAARVVQAFRRSDGVIMAQTTSDETTGDYRLEVFDAGPYDVRFKTLDGELLNDLFYANVTPEPVV